MGIVSLVIAFIGFIPDPSESNRYKKEVANLVLQATQELRYNSELLKGIAVGCENTIQPMPVGQMKVGALVKLANSEFERIVQYSYGEEKYIYQEIYRLGDLAVALGSPRPRKAIATFNSSSEYTLHDVIFLNNFLWWYLTPVAKEILSHKQLFSMGWTPFSRREFSIEGVKELKLRYFMDGDEPILEYTHYLSLLD